MIDIADRLHNACGYETIDPQVRSFQSSATNGLVLDAASEIKRRRRGLFHALLQAGRMPSEMEPEIAAFNQEK